MVHLQHLGHVPESPEQVPGVSVLKPSAVKPVFIAVLQQTLHSHRWNILDLQLAWLSVGRSWLKKIEFKSVLLVVYWTYFVKTRQLGISRPFSWGKKS